MWAPPADRNPSTAIASSGHCEQREEPVQGDRGRQGGAPLLGVATLDVQDRVHAGQGDEPFTDSPQHAGPPPIRWLTAPRTSAALPHRESTVRRRGMTPIVRAKHVFASRTLL